jgi:hypothetical protein
MLATTVLTREVSRASSPTEATHLGRVSGLVEPDSAMDTGAFDDAMPSPVPIEVNEGLVILHQIWPAPIGVASMAGGNEIFLGVVEPIIVKVVNYERPGSGMLTRTPLDSDSAPMTGMSSRSDLSVENNPVFRKFPVSLGDERVVGQVDVGVLSHTPTLPQNSDSEN